MKTLKELYEIVKASGGDFPFAVEWIGPSKHFDGDGPYLAFSRTASKNGTAVEDQDSFEIYSWLDDVCIWKFPSDSPYFEKEKTSEVYSFCKGKGEFKWKTNVQVASDCIYTSRTSKNITLSMPCPVCGQEKFITEEK